MELGQKKRIPRYTSYPPVPYWKNNCWNKNWIEEVFSSSKKDSFCVDVYIHIPYCQSLCYYCGCHKVISQDQQLIIPYLHGLKQEWALYKEKIPSLNIRNLHFGGGSPTFIPSALLEEFLSSFSENFSSDFIGSFEIDPRTVEKNHLHILKTYGFERLSLGIQDFDEKVQKKIHRKQPFSLVEKLVKDIRQLNFSSLNFDLIYGLPLQTLEGMEETLKLVFQLDPDVVASYEYAHLPNQISSQRKFLQEEIPQDQELEQLQIKINQKMMEAGYKRIGMDHYAKEKNFLYQAFLKSQLSRNFMGYVEKKRSVLLGLGVSSISSTPSHYRQNKKGISDYLEEVNKGIIPHEKGHLLTFNEEEIDKKIKKIMCYGEVDLSRQELEEQKWKNALKKEWLIFPQKGEEEKMKFNLSFLGQNHLRELACYLDPCY